MVIKFYDIGLVFFLIMDIFFVHFGFGTNNFSQNYVFSDLLRYF